MQRTQEPAAPPADFKDRSRRLTLFGVLAMLAGCGCLLLGLLQLILLIFGGIPGLESVPADAPSAAIGALLYGLLGAAFFWIGIGSIRKRRWVRPLMLTLAWSWLVAGLTVLFLLPALLDMTLGAAAPTGTALDSTLASVVRIVLLAGAVVAGVIVPALFLWAYNDRDVLRTCEASDPEPGWTERCPPSVLGLSVGLGAGAVVLLLGVFRPAVPAFGKMLVGVPGAMALLATAAASAWMAREVYRMTRRGWWATTAFLVLLGISTWITLLRVEPAEIYRAFGFPEGVTLPDESLQRISAWMTVAFTALTVVYLVAIRRHFGHGPTSD